MMDSTRELLLEPGPPVSTKPCYGFFVQVLYQKILSIKKYAVAVCRPNSTVVTYEVSYYTAFSGASSIPVTSNSCLVHPLARCLCGS